MWIKTSDEIPPEGKYVLGLYRTKDDQKNATYVVIKMVKGISMADREKMERGEIQNPIDGPNWCLSQGDTYSLRSKVYTSDDEWGNNLVPYSFYASDAGKRFFGQTITHWQPIDDAPTS